MANPIKVRAEVVSIHSFGRGVYEVRFRPFGSLPRFKAGQFLHLTIDEYDPAGGFWPESRVFSIASASGLPELEIMYCVKGSYTRRMEAILCAGSEVWLKLPYGSFVIDSSIREGQNPVLIAGGTGISPFLPYLEGLSTVRSKEEGVRLYYGIRENSSLLAGEKIGRWVARGLLEATIFVEDEEPRIGFSAEIRFERGRLDIDRIRMDAAELRDPVFFLSGPPAMIATFTARLQSGGVEPDHIKIDAWE